MSLQGLISGSECALPNNPLAQVLKHTDGDRSVQRDRIAGPSSSRLQHLPSTSSSHASERDLSMARQFFDTNSALHMQPGLSANAQSQLHLDFARRLESIAQQPRHQANGATDADLQDMWMRAEMQKNGVIPGPHASASAWTAEFGHTVANMLPTPAVQTSLPQTSAPQDSMHSAYPPSSLYQPSMGMGMGMYGMGLPQSYNPVQDQGKGKGKSRDDAFEAAFAQFASETSSAKIEEVHDEGLSGIEGGMRSASLNENETAALEIPATNDQFPRMWDHLQRSDLPPPDEDIARWEAEFHQLMQAQREELDIDYGASLRESWENGMGAFDADSVPQGMKFDEEGIPQLGPYVFDAENKYLTEPDGPSSLVQAKALLENNGSLSEAALLLEAAIQKGELGEGGYETWVLLGETRCMDEREEAGMRALTEGVRRANEAGARGVGMLSLATAFTNEGYERGSHSTLLRWLGARFPSSVASDSEASASLRQSHWASREHVTDAFLSVARAQHAAGVVDADVQTGLGILFYTSSDYDRAQDCFGTALGVRPRDYLLWNRLGSALSNGDRPEDALGAYREALRMRPTYTRAIYNVGVACLNIGADKEAAEHFLSALALQETQSGDKSEQLWFTLRRAFISMVSIIAV
ncbi:TPR-like protein [Phellopilus nigrolimitatus]|nr:TPR-like protein [Phellopilus nigrolimitatus]